MKEGTERLKNVRYNSRHPRSARESNTLHTQSLSVKSHIGARGLKQAILTGKNAIFNVYRSMIHRMICHTAVIFF